MEVLECNKTSKDSNDHIDGKDSEMNEGLLSEQLKRKEGDTNMDCKGIEKDDENDEMIEKSNGYRFCKVGRSKIRFFLMIKDILYK